MPDPVARRLSAAPLVPRARRPEVAARPLAVAQEPQRVALQRAEPQRAQVQAEPRQVAQPQVAQPQVAQPRAEPQRAALLARPLVAKRAPPVPVATRLAGALGLVAPQAVQLEPVARVAEARVAREVRP